MPGLPVSPLEMLKGELGVGSGLNTKGSLLLALILEEGEQLRPIPLVYVPVTDYAALLKGLGDDLPLMEWLDAKKPMWSHLP